VRRSSARLFLRLLLRVRRETFLKSSPGSLFIFGILITGWTRIQDGGCTAILETKPDKRPQNTCFYKFKLFSERIRQFPFEALWTEDLVWQLLDREWGFLGGDEEATLPAGLYQVQLITIHQPSYHNHLRPGQMLPPEPQENKKSNNKSHGLNLYGQKTLYVWKLIKLNEK